MASLNKPLTTELARCEFVDKRDNVIALDPSGAGKTHVALGLGLAACQKGLKVRFTTAAALVHELIEAADERRLQRLQKQLASQELLIIDAAVEQQLEWQELPHRKGCRIVAYRTGIDATDEADWPTQHAWFADMLEKMNRAFRKRVRNLSGDNFEDEGDNDDEGLDEAV